MNGMIYTEDSDGRYEMVYKKVWNHFCDSIGVIVSTGIFYERMREHHQQRRYGKCD